jgi:hypothetical protein
MKNGFKQCQGKDLACLFYLHLFGRDFLINSQNEKLTDKIEF